MAFSQGADPMLFAAVSAKGILAVYNAKIKARLALISGQGRAKALQWSTTGPLCLAVANDERQVRVYRHEDILASGANAQPVWQGTAPEQVRCLAWTAHGHLLAGLRALRGENTAYIWAVPAPAGPVPGPASASLLPTLEPRDGSQWILGANVRSGSPIAIPAGHGEIHAISASPDGRLVAIGGSEGIVQVADVVSGAVHGVHDKIAYVKWQLYLAHACFAVHYDVRPCPASLHLQCIHPSDQLEPMWLVHGSSSIWSSNSSRTCAWSMSCVVDCRLARCARAHPILLQVRASDGAIVRSLDDSEHCRTVWWHSDPTCCVHLLPRKFDKGNIKSFACYTFNLD